MIVTGGDTNVSVPFYFVDDVGGTAPGETTTGLLFSDIETGGSASYQRQGAARVDFTLKTLANAASAHDDGGFILVDDTEMPGVYRCDIPDAAVAAGVDFVIIYLRAASANNTITRPLKIDLTVVDLRETNGRVDVGSWLGTAAATPTVAGVPEVDITHLLGTAWLTPGTAGTPDVNMKLISDDATAADNLEAMYDGNGYVDPSAPSSRSQVDSIGATTGGAINIQSTEDNTGGAIIDSVLFVGSVQSGTFASTEAEDGVLHDIDDTANDIDIVYGFSIGGGRSGSSITFAGFVQGNSDEMKIKAYDHVGAAWDIIATIPGQNGTINLARTPTLLLKHTGTGSELGKVYIRIETDSTTPSNLSVDQLVVAAVNIGQSVGYSKGAIWVNTVNGTAGTEPFVNGVADKACASWANVKSLVASIGVTDIHVINGSTLTLDATVDNYSFFGDNWTLALGGQSVDGVYVQGAHVTGVSTAASDESHFEGCDVGTASVQGGHFDFCGFDGTLTQTLAGDYNYHDCYSKVAGAGAPIFTKTAGQAVTVEFRRWAGGITISGLQSGDIVTLGSGEFGTITLNGADATVEIRGIYKNLVNNLTGSPTVNIDGAILAADVAAIKVPTDKMVFTTANKLDSRTDNWAGTATTISSTTALPEVDAKSISNDATAADNLELQYDTTGLSGDTFPATQSQVGAIANTGAAVNVPAESYVLTTGTQSANTFAETAPLDNVRHEHTDTAGSMDLYYQFDVTNDGVPVTATMTGYLNGGNDNLEVYAYNWAGTSWDQIGIYGGTGSTTNNPAQTFPLYTSHVGTGSFLGKVRIRFTDGAFTLTTATLAVDQIYVSYSVIPQSLQTKGTVSDTTPTATAFDTDLTQGDNFWNDALITFTSGALIKQSRTLLDFADANGLVTVDEAFTSAPANGDAFIIQSTHIHPVTQIADAVLNRAASNIEDTADKHSLGAMIMITTNSSISGTTLTAKKPSDDTAFQTYTVTVDSAANPITGVS